jgi:hypothetical protein
MLEMKISIAYDDLVVWDEIFADCASLCQPIHFVTKYILFMTESGHSMTISLS